MLLQSKIQESKFVLFSKFDEQLTYGYRIATLQNSYGTNPMLTKFFDANLINLVEKIDAGDIGSVSLHNINEVVSGCVTSKYFGAIES